MHSRIFQVSTSPILPISLIDAEDYSDEHMGIDYTSSINNEDRMESIETLINYYLPSGMFKIEDENTLVYMGGYDEWSKRIISNINKLAAKLSPSKYISNAHLISDYIRNPLDTNYLFVTEWWGTFHARKSEALMELVETLMPGDKLYVGTVMDYHF